MVKKHGFDEKMGARPMTRIIQEHIKKPLAEELLFGQLVNGGHIRIGANADGLTFDYEIEAEDSPEDTVC